jgi:ribosomal protein L7Ae-like RNA K-turn-binding protein
MPTTWYVPRGGGAVATDASEPDGVSVAARLGELCEAVSTGGELVVIASSVGVSLVVRLGELCEAISRGGELVVVASAGGVSVVVRLGELCEAISTGVELVIVASLVAGVGDVATDRLFA